MHGPNHSQIIIELIKLDPLDSVATSLAAGINDWSIIGWSMSSFGHLPNGDRPDVARGKVSNPTNFSLHN